MSEIRRNLGKILSCSTLWYGHWGQHGSSCFALTPWQSCKPLQGEAQPQVFFLSSKVVVFQALTTSKLDSCKHVQNIQLLASILALPQAKHVVGMILFLCLVSETLFLNGELWWEIFSYPCLIKDAEMTRQSDSLRCKLLSRAAQNQSVSNRWKSLADTLQWS